MSNAKVVAEPSLADPYPSPPATPSPATRKRVVKKHDSSIAGPSPEIYRTVATKVVPNSPPASPSPTPRKGVAVTRPAAVPAYAKAPLDAEEDSSAAREDIIQPVIPSIEDPIDNDVSSNTDTNSELSVWRVKLQLDDAKCGAKKKNGEPCKNSTAAAKMDSINSSIAKLKRPSNTAVEIEDQLDNLAKIVHCHFHDHPPFRQARVDTWLAAIPGQPRYPSIERKLRQILGSPPMKCTGLNKAKNGTRGNCGNIVKRKGGNGGHKWYFWYKTVDRMVQVATAPTDDDDDLKNLVQVLRYYMLCHVHNKTTPYEHQNEWEMRVRKFQAACTRELQASRPTPPPSPEDPSGRRSPAQYWENTREISAFDILGTGDILDEGDTPNEAVRNVAASPLDKSSSKSDSELNDGYIYVYEVPGNDGLVKIGFTTNLVEKRKDQWEEDCHRKVTLLYPPPLSQKTIPHVHRVERLVHAELMDSRVRVFCKRCEKQHIEWFKASSEKAIAVIEKWSRWIAGAPYVAPEWGLVEGEKSKLEDMEKFLKNLE